MIRITIYAGHNLDPTDSDYEPSTTVRMVDERDVSEELRKLGLEWRQADYFPGRQTVITLDPVDPNVAASTEVKLKIREAADALERTGLL